MADVIGPNSYLPGNCLKVPKGAMCDSHPDREAVIRIVGETDSFGSELHDVCQECLDSIQKQIEEEKEKPKFCDWCSQLKKNVSLRRDPEEGSYGRLYNVCQECNQKQNQRDQEECDHYNNYYDD